MTQKLSKTSIVLLAVLAVLCLALAMLPMSKVNATTTEVGTIDALIEAVGTAAVYNTPAEIKLTQDVYYGTATSPKNTALEIPAQMEIGGRTYTVPEITIDLGGNTLHMYTTSNGNFGISNSSFTIKNGSIVAQSTTHMAIFGEVTPTPTEADAVNVTVQNVNITYTATGSDPSVLFANNSKVSVSLNGVSYVTDVDIARTAYAIDYASVFHGVTLQDKINLTNVYSTITLDRNYTESIVIPAGRGLTIDLGGHTLTNEEDKHTVVNYGTLTIKGNGKVDNVSHGCAAVLNREGGTLTLAGGTYTRSAENGKTNTYYVLQNLGKMTIGSDKDSTVTVYAGSDTETARTLVESSLVTTGYYNPADDKCETDDPVLTINGGKFYGGKITVKCDEKGTLNVTGGEFFASKEEDGSNDAIQGWNIVKVSGGTFHGPVSSWSYTSGDSLVSGTITITGGEFHGAVDSYHYDTSTGFSDPKDDGLTVSGGTFASPVRSCHLEVDGSSAVLVKTDSGYEVLSPTSAEAAKYVVFVQDGDVRLGYEGEEQALAAMSDKEAYILKEDVYYAYATLAEAVQAADSGDTVTLLKDVNVKDNGSSDGALYVTKSITIDGSRGTTAEKKGFAIAGTGNDAKRVIKIQATNGTVKVTLKNLVVESYFGNSAAMPVVTSGGNVTLVLNNVKIVADGGGNSQALTIGGVSKEGELVNVTITNSELTTNTAGYPIIVFNPVKMTITDSFLSGYTGIYFKGYYEPDGDLTGAPGASGSEVTVDGSTVTYAYNVHGQGQNDFGLYVFEDGGITLNVTDSVSAVSSTNGSTQNIVDNNVYPSGTYSPNNVTFTGGEIRLDSSGNTYFESGAAPEGSTLTVGGGTKLNFPLESKYLAEGSSLVFDEQGQITVANQPAIARIDIEEYKLSYEVGVLDDSVLNVLASNVAGQNIVPKITVLRDCALDLAINSAINLVLGEKYTDAEGKSAYAIPKVTGSITVNAAGTTISLYSGGTASGRQSTFNGTITNNSTDLTLLAGRNGTDASCCIVSGTITNNSGAVMYIGDGTVAGAGKIEATITNYGNVTIDVSRGYVYGDVTNSGTLTVTSVTSFGTSDTHNTLENTGTVTLEKGSYYTSFTSTAGTLNLEGTGSNYYGTFDVSGTDVSIQGGVFEKSAGNFLTANIDEKAYAITLTVSGNVERYKVVAIADVTMSIVRDGVTYGFTQLAHAINAAKDGETITLNKDVEASGVTINKSVTIDLGGHTLTTLGGLWARDMSLYQDPKTVTFKNGIIMGRAPDKDESAQAYALELGYGFTLVLEDVTVDYSVGDYGIQFATDGVKVGEGTYVATGATATLTNSKVTAGKAGVFLGGLNPANNGDTTGKQVTLKATGSEISGGTYGIVTNGTYTNAEIDLTDTKVTAKSGTAIFAAAQNSTTAVTGGEISGLTGIEVRAGSLTVTDAEITATGEYNVEANSSGTTVTGAAVAVSPHVTYQDVAVTINGGTFAATGTNGKSFAQVNTVKEDEGYQEVKIDLAVKDGEFKNDVTAEDAANFIEKGKFSTALPQNYLAEGSSVSAEGTVVAEAPGATVVQADGTAYSVTTLRDALIIAEDGATVTMLQGYTSTTSLVVGKAITLDLNGQTITNNGGKFALALTGDGSVLRDSVGGGKIVAEGAAALVLQPLNTTGYQGANLNFTVSNVTLQSSNSGVALNIWYSNVTLEKVTVTGAGRNDGTINGVQVVQKSDVTFKDSAIDITSNVSYEGNDLTGTGILVSDNAKVTLDGTTVNAKNELTVDGVAAQIHAVHLQNNSDAVVKNSTVTSTDSGIVILGKHFSMDKENHDEVMEQILAIKQEDYARLDIIDSVVESQASFAVTGNGTYHGTLINIEGSKIAVTGEAPAIYHPQYGVLNVGDGTEITGYTGVEMRAGTFNMTGGKIVATGEYEGENNVSGSTMSGVALALSQHTTNLPLAANISGGELTATSEKGKALMEYDFEADSTGTDGEKAIAITNGTFNGAVESQSVTNYAAGGKFSVLPAENAFVEGFEGMLYDGYYVPVEKTTSDVGALLTAQAQALTSVRTYVASVLNLTLAEVEAMDLAQAQALVAAIEQINNAQSVSAVAVATNNALNAADELKAALDAAAAEEAEQLAQAKTQFVAELNALAAGDETNAPVVVPTSTLAAIANAKTYEEAKAYYDNAVAEINDVRTFRAEVAAQTATLGELKEYLTQVGDALNAFGGTDGTFEKAIAEVNQAIADAQSAMLTAGAEALDDVKTDLESKIDQVNVTLQNAVNSLALELATVRQDVADAAAATDGKLDDVITAVEAAQAAISGGEATISQVAAAVQEVSNALDGAISELNTAIADVNNKLNAYNSTLNSLTGSLTTVGNELRNDVAAVAADLAVLADRIDGAATSDSVTDVASAVSKIASAIAALQQDVDSIANQVSASEAVETQKATAKTEILTWLNDYVDGITGGATAKTSVGRLFMATANAATASDQSDLYTKLEGAFGADNARLVLKYYNEAISAIDSALTVSDVTTAVSTFKAQVASVEAASGNATDLTVVYVLLAVAVVLVIVLLIMVAARKSDKGEAAATAEEPARQTEEAQPVAEPVAEEQPKQPEPQEAPADDDREQVVISANVRTFEEALDELEEDPRKLFDDVLNYALTKPDAVKVQRSNGLVVKQNGKQIVKLTVKRGNPVALFVLENDLLKDFRRNSDTPVKLKVRATEFVLRSEEDLPTAHMMVDLAVDQIQKDVEAAKERRKAARRAKRQAAAEEAAAAEAPASEE